MSTLNDRIKEVRKHFKLSQKDIADKLGVSQRSVSWCEQPGNNVTDATIKAFCLAFPVNETWLRTGAGAMLVEPDTFSLDQFARDRGATDLELEILKAYFELDSDIRHTVLKHFTSRLSNAPSLEKQDTADLSVQELEAEYKKSILGSASNRAASALNTTDDTAPGGKAAGR